MATALIEHEFDPTGINSLNLINDEQHNNIDPFSRILAPEHGRFFTESLIVKNVVNNTQLVKDEDYICIEFEQRLSLRTGKEVCRGILIVNDTLLPPFTLTYQSVGGEQGYANSNLLAVLEDKKLMPLPIEWRDVTDKPAFFNPDEHLHDIREIYGFEYIVAALSRIANAINIGCFPSYSSLLSYIDAILLKIKIDMDKYLDEKLESEMLKFKSIFTIRYFEINNLANLAAATELDGNNAGKREYKVEDLVANKYMTLEALVGLKNKFFDSFVSKKDSNYGYSVGRYELPIKSAIVNLKSGQTGTIISRLKAADINQDFTETLYPVYIEENKEFSITKLTNDQIGSLQLLLGIEKTNKEMFLTQLNADEHVLSIPWKRYTGPADYKQIEDALKLHIENFSDPHNVVKSQIQLGSVEDAEVVSKEEILQMKPIFKYVTFDGLLLFMRNFVLKNGHLDTKPKDTQSEYLTDNCVVVYSPPGYGCDQRCDFPAGTTLPPEIATTEIFVTLSPVTNVIPFNIEGFVTVDISGLINGNKYLIKYFFGDLTDDKNAFINDDEDSFIANGETHTLQYSLGKNINEDSVIEYLLYARVVQNNKQSNTKDSNVVSVLLEKPIPTTAPPTTSNSSSSSSTAAPTTTSTAPPSTTAATTPTPTVRPRANFTGFKTQEIKNSHKVITSWVDPDYGTTVNWPHTGPNVVLDDFHDSPTINYNLTYGPDGYYNWTEGGFKESPARLVGISTPNELTHKFFYQGTDEGADVYPDVNGYDRWIQTRVEAAPGDPITGITIRNEGNLFFFNIPYMPIGYIDPVYNVYGFAGYVVFYLNGIELCAVNIISYSRAKHWRLSSVWYSVPYGYIP